MKLKSAAAAAVVLTLLFSGASGLAADQMGASVSLTAQSYYNSGKEAIRMGDYSTAESMFTQGLKISKDSSASRALEALMHAGLGGAYLWQAKLSAAASELNKALSQIKKLPGDNAAETATILDTMAWLYQSQNKKEKAQEACRQALDLRRKLSGGKSKELAESLEHYGNLIAAAGLNDDAAKVFEEALAVRMETDGETSVNYADDLDLLGAVQQRLGHADRAQALFIQAISLKQNTHAVLGKYAPQPADDSVTFQYFPGSPNCSRSSSGGQLIQRITANQVLVEASIAANSSDFVKSTQAGIRISNGSNSPIDVLTQQPELLTLSPKLEVGKPLSSEQLAQKIEKKGKSKAGWIRFWGADAMTPVTTTMVGGGAPFFGYVPSNFGYAPPCVGCITPCVGCAPFRPNGVTTVTTMVPDWQARARAEQKAQQVTNRANADADSVRQNAFGPSTVPPGGTTGGTLNFPQSKFRKAILRVPVGNATFQFVFDLD